MATDTMPSFTPTQQRILDILSDGMPHTKSELMTCILNEMTDVSALKAYISVLNQKLRPIGQEIICRKLGYTSRYQHVRLLSDDE